MTVTGGRQTGVRSATEAGLDWVVDGAAPASESRLRGRGGDDHSLAEALMPPG